MRTRTRLPFRRLAALAVAALPLALLGCSDDDVDALVMSEAQVERDLNATLDSVDGGGGTVEPEPLSQWGCDNAFPSALPQGPPWRYSITRHHDEVAQPQIERWRTAALELTSRGFHERPLRGTDNDPRDIVMRDDRGFQVDITVSPGSSIDVFEVALRSSSPCVRSADE